MCVLGNAVQVRMGGGGRRRKSLGVGMFLNLKKMREGKRAVERKSEFFKKVTQPKRRCNTCGAEESECLQTLALL